MRNTPSTKGGARVPRRSGVVGLHVVPKLEEVAVDPGKTGVLDAHTTELLETAAIAALDALRKRKLILAAEARVVTQARCPDRLLRPRSGRTARDGRRLGLPQPTQTAVPRAARYSAALFRERPRRIHSKATRHLKDPWRVVDTALIKTLI